MKKEVFKQEVLKRVKEIYMFRMALNEKTKSSDKPSKIEILQLQRIPDYCMSVYFSDKWELMYYEDLRKSITIDGKKLTKQGYLDFLSWAISPTDMLYLECYPKNDKRVLTFIFKTENGEIEVNVNKPVLKNLVQDKEGNWEWVK